MSAATMILTIAAVLTFCGLMQRVLDRMKLTDKQALLLIVAMLIATFLPPLSIGNVSVGWSVLAPIGVCVYLLMGAETQEERLRSAIGSLITGAAVYLIGTLLPPEAESLPLDPMWLCGLAGGVIAWVLGRSRRCAYICGTLGVVLADVANFAVASIQGYAATLSIGGAGIADAVVVSGVSAVLLCELVGETIERLVRGRAE